MDNTALPEGGAVHGLKRVGTAPQRVGHKQHRSGRPPGAAISIHTATLWGRASLEMGGGGGGTRPWWLALLACGGAYWPLAFEPSAMTSRHPYYCRHPHCRGHPPAPGWESKMQLLPMASSPDGLISAQYAVIMKRRGGAHPNQQHECHTRPEGGGGTTPNTPPPPQHASPDSTSKAFPYPNTSPNRIPNRQ